MTGKLLFLFLVAANCYAADIDIEKYLKVCDRNSPDVNDCLVDAIQDGIAKMVDGIKELKLAPVDPYHQKEIRVEYNNNQIIIKMTMKDVYVEGLKEAKVHNVRLRADDDRFYIEIDMTTPQVFVHGRYHGEGSYNSLQINTTGDFNTTMSDLVYTWKLAGVPEKKNDKTYIRIESFYMRPDLGNLKAFLSSDDPATRELTNLGNDFANSNWKALYRELLPYAQANWNKIGIRYANKIFLKVPYDQLFPAKS